MALVFLNKGKCNDRREVQMTAVADSEG